MSKGSLSQRKEYQIVGGCNGKLLDPQRMNVPGILVYHRKLVDLPHSQLCSYIR